MTLSIQLHLLIEPDGTITIQGQAPITEMLHHAWRGSPEFHRLVTEALLTFDTEAGGQTMNLSTPAPAPENEPTP